MSYNPDAETEISPDLVFDLLSSQRRRMILYYLHQQEGTATVNEISKEIASMENDVPVEDLTRQQQKRVYVSLYQTHLPKLAQAGVIDYDRENGTVSLTDRVQEIDTYLVEGGQAGYPWAFHYLVLAVVGASLLVLSFAGIPVVASIPPLWIGLLVTAAFGLSAIWQYVEFRRRQREIPAKLTRERR